jgi:perosamine synthetase
MIPIAKPLIGKEEEDAVLEVLRSGMLAQGKKVATFEKAFADFTESKHALTTVNGTVALYLALKGCGIGEGDEVITTPFTFMATATSIIFAGAKPVLVDIDPKTFNIDPAKIEGAITERTKGIMPVHLYGLSAEMDPIMEIAQKHDLKVIEDACQAHGAMYKGRKVGPIGDAGCFSFYPTKNMTTGEGGMITTNNDEVAEKMMLLRNHGQKGVYDHIAFGFNFRMTDIAASIGLSQVKKLDGFNARRRKSAAYLSKALSDYVEVPYVPEHCHHIYHQYTLQSDEREKYMAAFKEAGVGCRVYYPTPIHKYKHMSHLAHADLGNAERAAERVFSLPVHPEVTKENLDHIISVMEGI